MEHFVSVIIPVKEIGYHVIFENLPALNKQTFKNFEVLVLPNQHTQYDVQLLKQYSWLRIIPTGTITRPALKRNLGVKESKGDIIAFIDDDAYPSEQWLEKAVDIFDDKEVAAVCGPGVLPKHTNNWEKIFDGVFQSWLGAGGNSYRFVKEKPRAVDDYPTMNFLIQKSMFEELGGFNNDYWPGEDSKLCEDLVYKKAGEILYDPEVLVYHHRRNTLGGYLAQHSNYGYHRGAFFSHGDKNSRRISYLIPSAFLLYLVLLFIGIILNNWFHFPVIALKIALLPLMVYGLLELALFLTSLIFYRNILIAFGIVLVLLLTHLNYGIMFIRGFIKGRNHNENIYD